MFDMIVYNVSARIGVVFEHRNLEIVVLATAALLLLRLRRLHIGLAHFPTRGVFLHIG